MADNEDAKNAALLYFMDHLMIKSGRRTIHDLSCQFGARGFTEQMKEAVGGTQESLIAFLSQYPSLFKIEGDEVSINQFGADGEESNKANGLVAQPRDAETEAVKFFVRKLEKFGPEVPIKSLLGHRSQAQADVRIVSGRHLKDFVDFLVKHNEAFVVSGDRVRLAKMPEPEDPKMALGDDGLPLTGARAKQAAVEYLKEFLEGQDEVPVPLEQLYHKFCDRFPHVVRQDVATNPKELLAFLKLNRHVFFIRSNKVSLVRPRLNADGTASPSLSSGDDSPRDVDGSVRTAPHIGSVKALKHAQLALADLLREPLMLHGNHVVAFDCKFVSLGPQTPEFLSLVVVGTPSRKYVVFDVAHSDTILLESGLKELLQSNTITKVMHDCGPTARTLLQRYNITISNVFDTQVAHAVSQHQRHGKALNEIRPISFINLQRVHHPASLMCSNANPQHRAQMNWAHRPLTDDSLQYICEQAIALMPTLYTVMLQSLTPEVMPLFQRLCNERLPGEGPTRPSESMSLVRQVFFYFAHQVVFPMRNPIAQASMPLLGNNNSSNAQNGALPVAVTRALQQATQGVQIYRPPHMQRQKSADLLINASTKPQTACYQCNCHTELNNNRFTMQTTAKKDASCQTVITGDVAPTSAIYTK